MTEKPEIAEAGIEAASGIDPAALAVALSIASRDRADSFLEEQTRLVRLQAEEPYADRKDEAREQFARATQRDLTPKSELARFNRV